MEEKTPNDGPFVQRLLAKRKDLEEQLDAVDKLLQCEGYNISPRHRWESISPVTKAQAIERALRKSKKPLRVAALITAMEEEGFRFNTENKKNALSNLLYGLNKLPWLVRTPEGFALKLKP